jgi:hypothetical protein
MSDAKNFFSKAPSIFRNITTQLQFAETYLHVSATFDSEYTKWIEPGLGECLAFCFVLKSDESPFIVRTYVQNPDMFPNNPIEWHIEANDLATAEKVADGLDILPKNIIWKKR